MQCSLHVLQFSFNFRVTYEMFIISVYFFMAWYQPKHQCSKSITLSIVFVVKGFCEEIQSKVELSFTLFSTSIRGIFFQQHWCTNYILYQSLWETFQWWNTDDYLVFCHVSHFSFIFRNLFKMDKKDENVADNDVSTKKLKVSDSPNSTLSSQANSISSFEQPNSNDANSNLAEKNVNPRNPDQPIKTYRVLELFSGIGGMHYATQALQVFKWKSAISILKTPQ